MLFTGYDRVRGLFQEVLQKPVGRVGSGQEVLEISRIESGRALTRTSSGRGCETDHSTLKYSSFGVTEGKLLED